MIQRYASTTDGRHVHDPHPDPSGEWGRWDDYCAAIHRLSSLLRDALPYVDACPYKRGSKTLAADIRQALGETDE